MLQADVGRIEPRLDIVSPEQQKNILLAKHSALTRGIDVVDLSEEKS